MIVIVEQSAGVGMVKTGQRTDTVAGCVLTCLKVWFLQGVGRWGRQILSVRPRRSGLTRLIGDWLMYRCLRVPTTGDWSGSWERGQRPPTRQRIEPCPPVEMVSELSIIRAMCCTATETQGWENLRCRSADKSDEAWWKFVPLPGYRSPGVISCIPEDIVPNFVRSGLKLRSRPIKMI